MIMRVNTPTRLTLFTACVNFRGCDIYDQTPPPTRWSIKLSHTRHVFPLHGHLAHASFLLQFTQAQEHTYKQAEGFMKDTSLQTGGGRRGGPLWFEPPHTELRGWRGGGGWTGPRHIREQILHCSHSAPFETRVTFFSAFWAELRARLPRSSTVISRRLLRRRGKVCSQASGCECFRNPIFKVKNSVRIPFLYAWNESLEAKLTKEIHHVLFKEPVSPLCVLKATRLHPEYTYRHDKYMHRLVKDMFSYSTNMFLHFLSFPVSITSLLWSHESSQKL